MVINKNHGFTLIEVMIVVAIVGVLMGIGVPAMRNFVMNSRMTAAVNDIAISLTLARSEAIKRGQNITITQTSGAWVNGWSVKDADNVILQNVDAMESATTLVLDTGKTSLVYASTGRLTTSPTVETFTLCDDRNGETGREITISATGRVSTAKYGCDP